MALEKDLGRPHFETVSSELNPLKGEINEAYDNVAKWAKPTKVSSSPAFDFCLRLGEGGAPDSLAYLSLSAGRHHCSLEARQGYHLLRA